MSRLRAISDDLVRKARGNGPTLRRVSYAAAAIGLLTLGPVSSSSWGPDSKAIAQGSASELPTVPADGVMGFVVQEFYNPVVHDAAACPDGTVRRLRERYLETLPAADRERLALKENEKELTALWHAYAFGPGETNVCSQPDMFDRPLIRTVQSPLAMGLDLDGDGGEGLGGANGCAQQDFTSPSGQRGIDNQEYRALGCTLEWRGKDGSKGDMEVGQRQFHASGEWTQVILLRGVDSFIRDDDVEVIYGNTKDRPYIGDDGNFLPDGTFSISDAPPRHRNVLKGKIVNGVLTTEPKDIKLTQAFGAPAREMRGQRNSFDYREGRLRLEFQPDGTLTGLLGGYRPVFDPILIKALGGAGTALVAGIDCSGELAALKKFADGLRNPKTGQCEGVSSAQLIMAIPAFVNDVPVRRKTASR